MGALVAALLLVPSLVFAQSGTAGSGTHKLTQCLRLEYGNYEYENYNWDTIDNAVCRLATCVALGQTCTQSSQCCEGACVAGICSLQLCSVNLGGACTTTDQCCVGFCAGGICTTGACTAALGEACTQTQDCCAGVCTNGFCVGQEMVTTCITIDPVVAALDGFEFFIAPRPIVLTQAVCHCQGPCATPPQVSFQTRDGTALPLDSVLTCDPTTAASVPVAFTSTPTLTLHDGLQFNIDNTPDESGGIGLDRMDVCVEYPYP